MNRQQLKAKIAHLSDKIRDDKKELEEDIKLVKYLQKKLEGGDYD